jgi:putative DNA primase/helicase
MNPADDLRHAMAKAGIDYAGPIHGDGKLHRFKSDDDKSANCYYVLHADDWPAGVFGCWKRGFKEIWHAQREAKPTEAQWQAMRAKWQTAEAEQQRIDVEVKTEAREKARDIFSNSERVDPQHPYLLAKGVGVHGELRQHQGCLVLPLHDSTGILHSLQFIRADGTKRFLPGGRIKGTFFTVADTDGPCVICEGYATGASIFEATNYATVCAMNVGNLLAVGTALREKWPDRELIIAADDDVGTPGNPGLTRAMETARAIHGKIAKPTFQRKANDD